MDISNSSRQTVMETINGPRNTGRRLHGKVCYDKCSWSGCEVKQVGALSLLQYHSQCTSKDKCIKYMNQQTASVVSRPPGSVCTVRLAVPGFGQEFTLYRFPSVGPSPRELLDLRFNPKGPVIFPVLNDTCTAGPEDVAKTKARQRPDMSIKVRGELSKGMKDLQITKLGDDQERRKWGSKKGENTYQWRKTEMDRERSQSAWPDNVQRKQSNEDSQERTIKNLLPI